MTPEQAAPLLQHQLEELRTAARETIGQAVSDLCDPHQVPDWSAHAEALAWCMTQAGIPTDQQSGAPMPKNRNSRA